MFDRQTCDPSLSPCILSMYHITTWFVPASLTWGITLNDWMVVHLKSGIATAAREAYNMVLAVIYYDGRLIDGDVIRPHIEDDTDFSLILQVRSRKWMWDIKVKYLIGNISYPIHSNFQTIKFPYNSGLSSQKPCSRRKTGMSVFKYPCYKTI